jgi:uncharacterized OB-fold protein
MSEAPTHEESQDVTIVETPIKLNYTYTPGIAAARFLTSIEQGRIVGERCPECGKVYVPPRGACSMCGVATTEGVELDGKGIVTTFAVTRIPSPGLDAPYVSAWVKLDGADITSMFLVKEIDPDDVRLGMRVEPVWVPEAERTKNLANIAYYRPTGEPDAPYETYRDYV